MSGDDDTPMPLPVAVKRCFPHGGATVNTLRAAIHSGDLQCAVVGRSFLVTEADIKDWINKCRNRAKARHSVSAKEKDDDAAILAERAKVAQAAALMMAKELTRPISKRGGPGSKG